MEVSVILLFIAATSMRYCACSVAKIGDPCTPSDVGRVECTLMPARDTDEHCNEYAVRDHQIAICVESSNGTVWELHHSCTDGTTCRTDGIDFECQQSSYSGCNDDEYWPENEMDDAQ